MSGVGFAEIDLGLGPTEEVVVVPVVAGDGPVGWLFSRQRVDPLDRGRSDPEAAIIREFEVADPVSAAAEFTVRIDRRADDDQLAEVFDWPVVATSRLTGSLESVGLSAFDGDPRTAWITPFDGAVEASLLVRTDATPIDEITILQRPSTDDAQFSTITAVEIRAGTDVRIVDLPSDGSGRAVVDPPLVSDAIEIVLTGVDERSTVDRRLGDVVTLPAAVAEISFPGAPALPPVADTVYRSGCVEVATLDERPLLARLSTDHPSWIVDGTMSAESCSPWVDLEAGTHVLRGDDGVFRLDRVVLDAGLRSALSEAAKGSATTLEVSRTDRYGAEYRVDGCVGGCWVVHGAGHNPAWLASVDGVDLGEPAIIDGGFNGWWVPPSSSAVTVEVRWAAQRPLVLAVVASLATVLLALALAVRRTEPLPPVSSAPRLSLLDRRLEPRRAAQTAVVWFALSLLLIGPGTIVWAAVGALAIVVVRSRALVPLIGFATVSAIACYVVVGERRWSPPPDSDWPLRFEVAHAFGMLATVAVLVTAVLADDDQLDRSSSG